MGALPKRKPSTHRQGRRRRQQRLVLPRIVICPQCGGEKLPHFICPHCGGWGSQRHDQKAKSRSKASEKKKSH